MSLRETSWHNGIADAAASTTVNQDNDEAAAAAFAISGPANGAQASPLRLGRCRVILLRIGSDCETPCYIAIVRPQSVVGGEDILRLLSIAADAVDPCPVWEPHGVVKKTFIQVRLLLIQLRVGRRL